MITNYARCTRAIKTGIAMPKAEFNKNILFTSKFDLNFKKKPAKRYILSTVL